MKRLTSNDIILTLAEKLPAELIREILPETTPDRVRDVLRSLAGQPENKTGVTYADCQPESAPSQPDLPFSPGKKTACSLYTDGASRGNPGEAGAGIVLYDANGSELAVRSAYLGKCTNNSAEYQALIIGLETALAQGCSSVQIFMDSELIVRQIAGRYKVKNEQLKPLFNRARDLLNRFGRWQVGHVPRAQNSRADQLANRGIDDKIKK